MRLVKSILSVLTGQMTKKNIRKGCQVHRYQNSHSKEQCKMFCGKRRVALIHHLQNVSSGEFDSNSLEINLGVAFLVSSIS